MILDHIWTVFAELEMEQPKRRQPVQTACYPASYRLHIIMAAPEQP